MQLYFVARGMTRWVRNYIEDLESIYLSCNTEKGKGMLQLMPRKVELYEMAFPEEHLDTVLQYMRPSIYALFVEKIMNLVRGLTGVGNKRINAAIAKGDGIPHPHVGIHVLGVKKDKRVAGGKERI